MRFLCLHGMGANGKVFELQTANIRLAVGGSHDYIFVDGTVPATPAPGTFPPLPSLVNMSFSLMPAKGIKAIAASGDEFLRFIIDGDLDSHMKLYQDLKEFVATEGPFDAIMGFSEGAGLAASIVADQMKHESEKKPSPFAFKCAVFFCAAEPIDVTALKKGVIRKLDVAIDGHIINIPTAHIWSMDDDIHVGFGQSLSKICTGGVKEEFIHNLGHSIPGARSDNGMFEATRAIQRTIDRAMELQ